MYPDRRQAGEGDAELVRRSRSGEPEAFDLLVERHTRRLYRVVRRLASDSGEAEAIVQETWLRAWRRLPECEESRPLFPWLAKVAMNVARDRWRQEEALAVAAAELPQHILDEEGDERLVLHEKNFETPEFPHDFCHCLVFLHIQVEGAKIEIRIHETVGQFSALFLLFGRDILS